jgi:cobalt-precorrin-5B (C1)-methyltransferase
MIGKLSKLAQGRFQTHVNEGEIDFKFLSELTASLGASVGLTGQVRTARTAHQVQNWLRAEGLLLEPELARRAAEQVFLKVGKQLDVEVFLFALNGNLLGKMTLEAAHGA